MALNVSVVQQLVMSFRAYWLWYDVLLGTERANMWEECVLILQDLIRLIGCNVSPASEGKVTSLCTYSAVEGEH